MSVRPRQEEPGVVRPGWYGQTHLAIVRGVQACELGMATRFFTAASLVTRLSESKRAGHLERTVAELSKGELVIIDEWGYLPMDQEEAHLLFQASSRMIRWRRR